ncbi:carboxypeptidase regulatory-like domain-containing protein [Silvibacterium sp.]|uniref:TonB-dependent receptor n=1 Tax=Silvibacterium sp. TaxID=1964179 RepID=UPI0039E65A6E
MFHPLTTGRRGYRRTTALFFGLILSTLLCGRLEAQTDTARIQGSVLDNTGAAIPGATITLTDVDTGITTKVASDGAGNFTFNALVRGHYQAQVQMQGFDSQVQSFELQVSQVEALNFKLNPGAVTTTVTVTDAASLVDTTTSSTGAVIQGRQITELPLNGRNFTQLAVLVPGVTRGAYGSDAAGANGNAETWRNSDTGSAALSVNGTRTQANNFELDGLDNNDALVNTIIFFPPVEATQEFRVNTSMAPAEFGRAGGAIVQSSIKSGSNEYHGSAFLFDRDQIFDASPNYFSPTTAAPSFHRAQYGGTFGFPIWKDKLFGFVDYQGSRSKAPEGETFETVPTALMRTGDFSELLSSGSTITTTVPYSTVTGCNTTAGPKGTIYDPVTCAAFANNAIPTTRMTQAGYNYLNAFPLPNNGAAQGNNTLQNNYVAFPTEVQKYDDFDARLDYHASSHDSFFGRYSYGQDTQIKSSALPNLPAGYGSGTNPVHPRGEAFGWTHVFTANLVNEFRYGYIHDVYGYVPPLFNEDVSANLGIQNANRNANLGGGAAINGGYLTYTGDGGLYTIPQWSNQFVDEVSWTHGPHTVKFGASVEKRAVQACCATDSKGYFDYSGAHFTGFSMTDMLAGFVDDYSIGVASNYFTTKNWETGYFVQDDWKATRRLTLNLGFRYDLYTFPYESNNYYSNFNLDTLTLQQAGTDGLSRSIVHTDKTDFAPRFGFAYDVFGNGRTALRGGYGIFYFLDRGGYSNQLFDNPDFMGAASYSDLPSQGNYRNNFAGQAPTGSNNNQAVNTTLPLPVFGQTVNRLDPVNAALISVDTHLPTSMIQEYNLQLQQQITHNTSLTIAYVGTNAQHLRSWFNLNSQVLDEPSGSYLYPAFSSIERGIANGRSNYNGLQVFLNSAMSHGIQYTAAYTWSHTLDDSNGAFSTGTAGSGTRIFIEPTGPNFKANYGNSDQDQRQVFTFSTLAEIPFGRGRKFGANINPVVDKIVGGWQINAIASLLTGSPFDVSTSNYFYQAADGTTSLPSASLSNRANLVKPIHYTKSLHEWFDTTSFEHPAVIDPNGQESTFIAPGSLGRNQMFGPSYRDLDMSLFKNFPIVKSVMGEFRAEAYNLTNTPAFTNPNGSLDSCTGSAAEVCQPAVTGSDSGSFGQINGTRSHSERQLQLAFRLQF